MKYVCRRCNNIYSTPTCELTIKNAMVVGLTRAPSSCPFSRGLTPEWETDHKTRKED